MVDIHISAASDGRCLASHIEFEILDARTEQHIIDSTISKATFCVEVHTALDRASTLYVFARCPPLSQSVTQVLRRGARSPSDVKNNCYNAFSNNATVLPHPPLSVVLKPPIDLNRPSHLPSQLVAHFSRVEVDFMATHERIGVEVEEHE
jgi:hypothetical protein